MNYKGIMEGNRIAKKLISIEKNRTWYNRLPHYFDYDEMFERKRRQMRKTRVPCSCFFCRWKKRELTKQEQIAIINEREQLKEEVE